MGSWHLVGLAQTWWDSALSELPIKSPRSAFNLERHDNNLAVSESDMLKMAEETYVLLVLTIGMLLFLNVLLVQCLQYLWLLFFIRSIMCVYIYVCMYFFFKVILYSVEHCLQGKKEKKKKKTLGLFIHKEQP